MLIAVCDTHALLWYLYGDSRLSSRSAEFFRSPVESGNRIGFSTISLVEIIFLQEKDRIPAGALTRIDNAIGASDSVLPELQFDRLVAM